MKDFTKIASITYTMMRGSETVESIIDMLISTKRYKELQAGCQPNNAVWHEIRDALVNLTRLQGYDELGEWNIELKIETEE